MKARNHVSRNLKVAPRFLNNHGAVSVGPMPSAGVKVHSSQPLWKMPAARRPAVSSACKRAGDYSFEPFLVNQANKMAGMITPLLPKGLRKQHPMLLETEVAPGLTLMIGATGKLSAQKPGNGGFRIWNYANKQDAAAEAVALAQGMEIKHMAYNTGCSGAKVVCNIGDRTIQQVDKKELLDHLNKVLLSLNGSMYTGCDLNSTLEDMEYLAGKSPYILAAIGNDTVDPNHATAHGVVGAVLGVLKPDMAEKCDGSSVTFNEVTQCEIKTKRVTKLLTGKTLLVHGCGAVGSVVARELAAMGAKVLTIDTDASKADVVGCRNITGTAEGQYWWTLKVDAIVPCSASGLITVDMIKEMQTDNIVGASNLPFFSAETQKVAERGVTGGRGPISFIPEGITSAGAVIVDSVEQHDNAAFTAAKPDELYAFCRQHVFARTADVLALVKASPMRTSPSEQLPKLLERVASSSQQPIGELFRAWAGVQASDPVSAVDSQRALLRFSTARAASSSAAAAAAASSSSSSAAAAAFSARSYPVA